MNHFDEMTAFLYLDGQLERAQAHEVAEHAGVCSQCRELLASLRAETTWLEESLMEHDPVPARFAPERKKSSVHWGWITVLGMMAAGIYTIWNGVMEPLQQQLSQAGFGGTNLITMLFFSGAFWKGWSSVLSFIEFFTVAMFAAVILVVLQKFWRRDAALGMVLAKIVPLILLGPVVCALGLGMLAQPVHAAEAVHGKPSYTLPAGQTVNTDLFILANSVRIEGNVNGDVIVWAQTVQIDGHVAGDVIAWAQDLRINGKVDGDVHAGVQELTINGTVGRSIIAGCSDFELNPGAKVLGSVTMGGGIVNIFGSIAHDLTAGVGNAKLDGPIGGNVAIRGDNLRISQNADIRGTAKYHGRHTAEIDPGAKLASPLAFTFLKKGPSYTTWRYYWHRAIFWGAAFLFGLVFLLLLPKFFAEALTATYSFLPSLGFGVLFMFATPIIAVLVCLTIVGIGIGVPTLLIWLIALYAAQIFVATWLGDLLLGAGAGTGALLGRLALGLGIIHALELIPFHVGFIVKLVVVWWGLGAIAIAIYRHLHRVSASPVPVAA